MGLNEDRLMIGFVRVRIVFNKERVTGSGTPGAILLIYSKCK
jgi:hypothetical protein